MRHFAPGQAGVHADQHGAAAGDAIGGDGPVDLVGHPQCDAIAGLHIVSGEHTGEQFGTPRQFGKADHFGASSDDQIIAFAVCGSGLGQHAEQVRGQRHASTDCGHVGNCTQAGGCMRADASVPVAMRVRSGQPCRPQMAGASPADAMRFTVSSYWRTRAIRIHPGFDGPHAERLRVGYSPRRMPVKLRRSQGPIATAPALGIVSDASTARDTKGSVTWISR